MLFPPPAAGTTKFPGLVLSMPPPPPPPAAAPAPAALLGATPAPAAARAGRTLAAGTAARAAVDHFDQDERRAGRCRAESTARGKLLVGSYLLVLELDLLGETRARVIGHHVVGGEVRRRVLGQV